MTKPDITPEAVDWPREIWMAELDEHHNGTGMVVLSEFATVPRWEGDDERDGDFNRYIDANIYDSAERYHKERHEAHAERIAELEAERDAFRAVLEGAGFGDIDGIGKQDPELNRLLGLEVARLTQLEGPKARNAALREAAHECEQVAYSGKYPQDDQSELGCLRCRDNILALIEGDTND